MTAKEFAACWQQRYAKSPPVGYLLRAAYKERWFRIHCLPESKRYPENEGEYQEILRRHNAILADILGRNGEYVLITTGYSETPEPTPPYRKYRSVIGHHERLMSVPCSEDDPQASPRYWHFYMSRREWKTHSLDDLLRLIADDLLADVLLAGVNQNCLYHPYDGGADIILESKSARDWKKKQYAAWLPKNPQGL
jgi:hypothetical protein